MRTKKKIILDKLAAFFNEQGKLLSEFEYKKAGQVPVKPAHIRRYVGSWARLMKFMQGEYVDQIDLDGDSATTDKVEVAPKTPAKPAVKAEVKTEAKTPVKAEVKAEAKTPVKEGGAK